MSSVSKEEWDQFISNYPEAHFMQTSSWGELKSSFGWNAARVIKGSTGAQILFRELPLGFSAAYIPKGPLGIDFSQLSKDVDQLCRKHRAILLKIEPDRWVGEHANQGENIPGFITSQFNIQPPNTILVDLEQEETEILNRMRQKTRYNINLAQKKGVTVQPWKNIESFHQMLTLTGQRDRFGVHSREYYQRVYDLFQPSGKCELLAATFEGKTLAALIIIACGKRAWYVYGASSDEERNRMPTYLLQWEAMRWAKSRGCVSYDLWGVPDEDEASLEANFMDRKSGLWGVYRFKRGFGGTIRRSTQAMDKIYMPFPYLLYKKFMAGRGST